MYKLGFIGFGNMASAMLGGMLHTGILERGQVACRCSSDASTQTAAQRMGIAPCASSAEVAKNSEIVVLTVKPQLYEGVIAEIAPVVEQQTILTVAPGKTLAWLQERFGKPVALVRCMPNTPAQVGEGCTAVCRNEAVPDARFEEILKLLGSFGTAQVLPERLFDAFVGVCGSSPAYVYMFIEAMADAAVLEGIPRQQAYAFAAQVVLGSAKMVLDTGKHPAALKDAVCSPGGTTIEAVRALEERGFRAAVMQAVTVCTEKSKSM